MAIAHDLTGLRFGRLVVIRRSFNPKKTGTRWLCLCDCGKEREAVAQNLKSLRHASCGCGIKGTNTWKAKPKTSQAGYTFVRIDGHHRANPHTGRVREHIVIMEGILGRRLLPKEEVHHKNGIRHDNREENLELWSRSQPSGARVADLIEHAEYILKTYAGGKLK